MFINSDIVDFDDECAELLSKCQMPSLECLEFKYCKISEKGAEYISKTECENLKEFICKWKLN